MQLPRSQNGFTLVDLIVAMGLMAVALGTAAPLSQRVIARYELNTAAQTLVTDLSQAKIRAIQTNAVTVVSRESARDYRAAGYPRQLPERVRFADSSAESLSFNGLGAMADMSSHSLVLVNTFGDKVEIRVYAAGGQEVRKL